nr:MAG: hypothetical protein 3 [Leviviridae sp.]
MRITRWDQTVSTEKTNELLKELATWHMGQIANAPTEREYLRDRIDRGDFLSVCDFDISYQGLAPLDAYHLRQIQALYSKRQDLDVGIDKEAAALEKFEAAERLCGETNTILKLWGSGKFQFARDVEQVFHLAQRKIAQLLGDGVPSLADLRIRFGPGATTQVQKRMASARQKLSEVPACSEDLLPVVSYCMEEMPGWFASGDAQWVEDVDARGNPLGYCSWPGKAIIPKTDKALVGVEIHRARLSFVPKTLKTDRSIAVEPSLNTMFQAGFGSHLADRLKRVGVDIRDQTRNQRLAREGSLTGALATLDLSSASDTVARELVFHLLPIDWAIALDFFRTSEVEYKNGDQVRVFRLQKFSSMGNGFTFPLETLIFWALTAASTQVVGCRADDVSVYGDDIICPVEAYPLLCRVLHAAGFIPNEKKSFASGPFRESCGKDYISGIDIRPVHVKDRLSGADAFVLHNYYVRTWQPEPASIVRSWLSKDLIIFGPDGYGDGHLLGDWTTASNTYRKRDPKTGKVLDFCATMRHKRGSGYAGYTFETYTWKPRRSFALKPGDGFYPAYSIYVSEQDSSEIKDAFWETHCKLTPEQRRSGVFHGYSLRERAAMTPHSFDRDGNLGVTLPGTRGCRRIKIYTFDQP